jgi:hypothetical protein
MRHQLQVCHFVCALSKDFLCTSPEIAAGYQSRGIGPGIRRECTAVDPTGSLLTSTNSPLPIRTSATAAMARPIEILHCVRAERRRLTPLSGEYYNKPPGRDNIPPCQLPLAKPMLVFAFLLY